MSRFTRAHRAKVRDRDISYVGVADTKQGLPLVNMKGNLQERDQGIHTPYNRLLRFLLRNLRQIRRVSFLHWPCWAKIKHYFCVRRGWSTTTTRQKVLWRLEEFVCAENSARPLFIRCHCKMTQMNFEHMPFQDQQEFWCIPQVPKSEVRLPTDLYPLPSRAAMTWPFHLHLTQNISKFCVGC